MTQQGYIEVRIGFDEYIKERTSRNLDKDVRASDVLMAMFRERGVSMDSGTEIRPTPPVEIVTDIENAVFVIKQWAK